MSEGGTATVAGQGVPEDVRLQIVGLVRESSAEVTVAIFPAAYKRKWGVALIAADFGCKKLSDVLRQCATDIYIDNCGPGTKAVIRTVGTPPAPRVEREAAGASPTKKKQKPSHIKRDCPQAAGGSRSDAGPSDATSELVVDTRAADSAKAKQNKKAKQKAKRNKKAKQESQTLATKQVTTPSLTSAEPQPEPEPQAKHQQAERAPAETLPESVAAFFGLFADGTGSETAAAASPVLSDSTDDVQFGHAVDEQSETRKVDIQEERMRQAREAALLRKQQEHREREEQERKRQEEIKRQDAVRRKAAADEAKRKKQQALDAKYLKRLREARASGVAAKMAKLLAEHNKHWGDEVHQARTELQDLLDDSVAAAVEEMENALAGGVLAKIYAATVKYAGWPDQAATTCERLQHHLAQIKARLNGLASCKDFRVVDETIAEFSGGDAKVLGLELKRARERRSQILKICTGELCAMVNSKKQFSAKQIAQKLDEYTSYPAQGAIGDAKKQLETMLKAKREEEEKARKAAEVKRAKEEAEQRRREQAEAARIADQNFWAEQAAAEQAAQAEQDASWERARIRAEEAAAAEAAATKAAEDAEAERLRLKAEAEANMTEEEKARVAEQKRQRAAAKKERQKKEKEAKRAAEAAQAAAAAPVRKSNWVAPVCTLPSALRAPGSTSRNTGCTRRRVTFVGLQDLDPTISSDGGPVAEAELKAIRAAEKKRVENRKKKEKRKLKEAAQRAQEADGDFDSKIDSLTSMGIDIAAARRALLDNDSDLSRAIGALSAADDSHLCGESTEGTDAAKGMSAATISKLGSSPSLRSTVAPHDLQGGQMSFILTGGSSMDTAPSGDVGHTNSDDDGGQQIKLHYELLEELD
eukprot:SAG31_NODE_3611_length_4068_cov_2.373142_2_plen_873_part_00